MFNEKNTFDCALLYLQEDLVKSIKKHSNNRQSVSVLKVILVRPII